MRTLRLALALVSPAVTGGARLAAQAVERTDVPARGVLRVTFDPRIMTWNDEFTDAGRLKLGAPLTGDTVGGRYIPVVARRERARGLRGEPRRGPVQRAPRAAHLSHHRRARHHESPLRESHGPDGPRANAGLAAAFEQRCQPRREPAGGEHAGGTREGLGGLRAIRLRAGATRPAGRGMCAAPVPECGAGQLGALAWRAR